MVADYRRGPLEFQIEQGDNEMQIGILRATDLRIIYVYDY